MPARIHVTEIENPIRDARDYVLGWLRDELDVEAVSSDLAVDAGGAFDRTRHQFSSTALLAALLAAAPADGGRVLAITGVDLYIPVLTFVYGEAQLDGRVAIASTYRLRNTFYGLAPDRDATLTRVLKESLHELGHTMGLLHCPDYRCVMCASTSVEEIDLKAEAYCASCRAVVDEVISAPV